ncbi:MAG: hypothetical protein AAGJ81_04945 [Verrucomicrobiota bacterium]
MTIPYFSTVLFLGAVAVLWGKERQGHGLDFEQEVWNHLFDRGYTDEWDIPGGANLRNPGVPISVKLIQWGSSVYLGDAVRQRSIREPFELVVGFYEKDGEERKLVALHQLEFSPEEWDRYWGDISLEELEELSSRIKGGSIEQAQEYARVRASELREQSVVFSVNPKINKDQRRVQCSVPFRIFYETWIGEEPVKSEDLELWGRPWDQ